MTRGEPLLGWRVLLVLGAAVVGGVRLDLFIGSRPLGYGAGLGAAGVVTLTLAAHFVGAVLRRDDTASGVESTPAATVTVDGDDRA